MKNASKLVSRNNKRKRASLAKLGRIAASASLLLSGAPGQAQTSATSATATTTNSTKSVTSTNSTKAVTGTNSVGSATNSVNVASSAPVDAAPAGGSTSGGGSSAKPNLFDEPLENLLQKVYSPSKKEETVLDAAASIFVITGEDIRRSGVTSIPEALRLSPGVEVARQDAHTWAISSRGFNDEFANQLLVLIDGRSVYTPLFAGVYWDVQDLMLEDVDRIEVIRGPGATLWGANAVNGVINITTKSAKDTQGLLVTGGGGTEEYGGAVRYGAKLHENGYLRVYGKWFDRDESKLPNGQDANDAWSIYRGGFRYDWIPTEQNTITLQGDLYYGSLDQSVMQAALPPTYATQNNEDVDVKGANVLGKWVHNFSADSELALKVYYDHTWRDRVVFAETRNTFDIDLQHRIKVGNRNDIVWGLGYNLTADELDNTFMVSFDPSERTTQLASGFVQDEITLIEKKLRLTLGTKVEHNDYTGWEVQPSARLSYSITPKQTAWFSASRAISTPSRAEHNIRINRQVIPAAFSPTGADTVISLNGSDSMRSKQLIGFELGYRLQAYEGKFTTDIATFYNVYDKQRSIEGPGAPDFATYPGVVTLPFTIGNSIDGETYGFEVSSTFKATEWWRIRANYSFLKINLHLEPGSTDPLNLEGAEHDSPVHQVGIRSLMDLPYDMELDGGMRYVDSLSNRGVPSYIVGDVRLGWRSPHRRWEISVTGQNLFDTHQEFAPSYIPTQVTEVETSVFAKVTFRY
jgi:iron complex outermembrane recepter protein